MKIKMKSLGTAVLLAAAVLSVLLMSCENEPEPVRKGSFSIVLDALYPVEEFSYIMELSGAGGRMTGEFENADRFTIAEVPVGKWNWKMSVFLNGDLFEVGNGEVTIEEGKTVETAMHGVPLIAYSSNTPEGSSDHITVNGKTFDSRRAVFWVEAERTYMVDWRAEKDGVTTGLLRRQAVTSEGKITSITLSYDESLTIGSIEIKAEGADEFVFDFIGASEGRYRHGDVFDLVSGDYVLTVTAMKDGKAIGTHTREIKVLPGSENDPIEIKGKSLSFSVDDDRTYADPWQRRLTITQAGMELGDPIDGAEAELWLLYGDVDVLYEVHEDTRLRGRSELKLKVDAETKLLNEIKYVPYTVWGEIVFEKSLGGNVTGVETEFVLIDKDGKEWPAGRVPVGTYDAVFTVKRNGEIIGKEVRHEEIKEGTRPMKFSGPIVHVVVAFAPENEGWTHKLTIDGAPVSYEASSGWFWLPTSDVKWNIRYSAFEGEKQRGAAGWSDRIGFSKGEVSLTYSAFPIKGAVKLEIPESEGYFIDGTILKGESEIHDGPDENGWYELVIGEDYSYDVRLYAIDENGDQTFVGKTKETFTVEEDCRKTVVLEGRRITFRISDVPQKDKRQDHMLIDGCINGLSSDFTCWLPYGKHDFKFTSRVSGTEIGTVEKELTVGKDTAGVITFPFSGKAELRVKAPDLYGMRVETEITRDGNKVTCEMLDGAYLLDPGTYSVKVTVKNSSLHKIGWAEDPEVVLGSNEKRELEFRGVLVRLVPMDTGFENAGHTVMIDGMDLDLSKADQVWLAPGKEFSYEGRAWKMDEPNVTLGTAFGTFISPTDLASGAQEIIEFADGFGIVSISCESTGTVKAAFRKDGRDIRPVLSAENTWTVPRGTYTVMAEIWQDGRKVGGKDYHDVLVKVDEITPLRFTGIPVTVTIPNPPTEEGLESTLSFGGQLIKNGTSVSCLLEKGKYKFDYTVTRDGLLQGKVYETVEVTGEPLDLKFEYKPNEIISELTVKCPGIEDHEITITNSDGTVVHPEMKGKAYLLPPGIYTVKAEAFRGTGADRTSLGIMRKLNHSVSSSDPCEIRFDGVVIEAVSTDSIREEIGGVSEFTCTYRYNPAYGESAAHWNTEKTAFWVEKGATVDIEYKLYESTERMGSIHKIDRRTVEAYSPSSVSIPFVRAESEFYLNSVGTEVYTTTWKDINGREVVPKKLPDNRWSLPYGHYTWTITALDGDRIMGTGTGELCYIGQNDYVQVGGAEFTLTVPNAPEKTEGLTEKLQFTGADPVDGNTARFWKAGSNEWEASYEAYQGDKKVYEGRTVMNVPVHQNETINMMCQPV